MTQTIETRSSAKSRFTVEMALYAVILALGLVLRLVVLGRWPLLDGEAALALAAWRFARALPASLRGSGPLLFNWSALCSFLTGGSDGLTRAPSILFGSALVLWPYGLRRYLGRVGALAVSLMLAISPSFVYFSRVADGSVIVAFCALGWLCVLAGYHEERRPVYVLVAAVLAMLGLLAAPLVYTLFGVLLTFPVMLWVRARVTKRSDLLDELGDAWHSVISDSSTCRKALLAAGLLLLVAGLGFMVNPSGLQMALDQFGQWVGGFSLFKGTWWLIPLLLFMYEGLALVFGLGGLLLERRRSDVVSWLLRYWLVFAVVFSIVPGYRPPGSVLLVLLPLIVASGHSIERLWMAVAPMRREPWLLALVAASLLICGAALIQFVTHLAFPSQTYLLRIAALIVFALSLYALVWSLAGAEIPLRAGAVSLLLLLLLGGLRAEVRLNYYRARDAREPMVGATVSPDVLKLAQYAQRFSSQVLGDPRAMDWQVDQSLEIPLGWYLRHFDRVSYVSRPPLEPRAAGMILPAAAPAPAKYVGLRFAVHASWQGGQYSLVEWLRWWTGQKPALPDPASEEVILWVRSPQP